MTWCVVLKVARRKHGLCIAEVRMCGLVQGLVPRPLSDSPPSPRARRGGGRCTTARVSAASSARGFSLGFSSASATVQQYGYQPHPAHACTHPHHKQHRWAAAYSTLGAATPHATASWRTCTHSHANDDYEPCAPPPLPPSASVWGVRVWPAAGTRRSIGAPS